MRTFGHDKNHIIEYMQTALLSSVYFGPVQWFQKLNRFETCIIEQYDNFVKQTYRNRCVIATANGIQVLSIPVERFDELKCQMKDVRISDHANWRHVHWHAILSAYGESPFFELYQDEIRPFFERRWKFLLDFNLDITQKICELLDIQPKMSLSLEYLKNHPNDFRETIRPKHPLPDPDFASKEYYQVYRQKNGFQPNLSILDLLFNEGNESIFYL